MLRAGLMCLCQMQELLTKHKVVSEEFRRVTFHSRAVQVSVLRAVATWTSS